MNSTTRQICISALVSWALVSGGCAPAPSPPPTAAQASRSHTDLNEKPVRSTGWRGHRLAACPPDLPASPEVEARLALCAEYFSEGSGGDGMMELEMALGEGQRDPLILMVLG